MAEASCADCGRPYLETSTKWPRPPCSCGSHNLIAHASAALVGKSSLTADLSLVYDASSRDWRWKWQEMEAELAELTAPIPGPAGGTALTHWPGKMLAFLVKCYHLKDALKAELPGCLAGASQAGQVVEDAVTQSPELARLADLANLEKHHKLDRTPRSSALPQVQACTHEDLPNGTWLPRLAIQHKGTSHDAIQLASAAVAAWRQLLTSWQAL